MQITVRYDKVHPPRRIDIAEAITRAVVSLLASPATAPGEPWNPTVDYWRNGRIRKLMRRTYSKRWEEVQDIDGVTVTQDGPAGQGQAATHTSVPGLVHPLPGALAKTQVEDTHFPPGDELPPPPVEITARVARSPATTKQITLTAVSASNGALVTIEVAPLREMTSSELAIQYGHTAQLAQESSAIPPALRQAWTGDRYRVCVVVPSREQWEVITRLVSVTDADFTKLGGLTETIRASW